MFHQLWGKVLRGFRGVLWILSPRYGADYGLYQESPTSVRTHYARTHTSARSPKPSHAHPDNPHDTVGVTVGEGELGQLLGQCPEAELELGGYLCVFVCVCVVGVRTAHVYV